MTTRFRPLCLDPFEDRAVPSRGHFVFPPPDLTVATAHRADLPAPADERDEPGKDGPHRGQVWGVDERGPHLTGPGRSEFGSSRLLVAVVVPPRVEGPAPAARTASATPIPIPPPVADRSGEAVPERPPARAYVTEAVAGPTRAESPTVGPAAGVVVRPIGQVPAVAVHEAILGTARIASWTSPAPPTATPGNTGPTPSAAPFVAANPVAPSTTQGQSPPTSLAAVAAAPTGVAPEAVVSTPPDTSMPATPPAEAAPPPSLVGRVIEAVFPAGGPLGGVLPVDVIAVDADAAGLLAGLADLGDSVADGWAGPERWAWLTAAALAAGGVGYVAVGDARGRRRAGPVAAATDSALARWEERNGDRTG